MVNPHFQVAIALIIQHGKILIGWRDEQLAQGGCFEFAGGKIETDESPLQAVIREVQEEVGMIVQPIKLFDQITFDYPQRAVTLYFILCHPVSSMGDICPWQWVDLDRLNQFIFPKANSQILKRLIWQRQISIITDIDKLSTAKSNLIYLRHLSHAAILNILTSHIDKTYIIPYQQYLQLPTTLQDQVFAIHLNHQELWQPLSKNIQHKNIIAACHTQSDIHQANHRGCDAIFLSPVHKTTTHPEAIGIGWQTFSQLAAQAKMPTYALGGIKYDEIELAKHYGAYGVAGIQDFSI